MMIVPPEFWRGVFWFIIFSIILWAFLAFAAYGIYLIGKGI